MGEVWRARDTVLGREVAVKVLKHEYADDPTFRARFEAEARHAAGLHHPGIASVFDFGVLEDGETPYLVMELVEGKPLSELLGSGRALDPEQTRALVIQAADALGEAHAAGVVHRDVKPANLLVTPDGVVKITDFGIARAGDQVAITQTGQIVGTPHYLSPEQAEGQTATPASDVYALGVLLYECLVGQRPFVADTPVAIALAHIRQDIPALPDTVPPDLAAVTYRALAKDPAERYPDGAALAAALRTEPVPVAEHTQVLPAVAAPVAATQAIDTTARRQAVLAAALRDRSRWPLYLAGLLALLLLVALLVAHPWSDDTNGTGEQPEATPSPSATQAETVRVDAAKYIGEPADQVRSDLRSLGLTPRTETKDNPGGEDAGTVAALSPTGRVEKGATITLRVWSDPPKPTTTSSPSGGKGGDKPSKSKGKGKKG
jgi:serine/threonine-protein kinase